VRTLSRERDRDEHGSDHHGSHLIVTSWMSDLSDTCQGCVNSVPDDHAGASLTRQSVVGGIVPESTS
jgi:hypothetical protein